MTAPTDLPSGFAHIADLLGELPPEMRKRIRHALMPELIDDEQARRTRTRIQS